MHEIIDDQLVDLREKLEMHIPESYKVLGHLQEQGRNNGFVNRYFVDSWPEVSAVIAIPGGSDPRLRFHGKIVTSFAVSEFKMKTALLTDMLDWTKPITFGGFPCKYLSVLEEVIAIKGNPIPIQEDSKYAFRLFHMMEATMSDLPELSIPKHMTIGELNSSHAEYVHGTRELSKTEIGAYDYIQWTIETQPSVAIFDTKNKGTLVGFMIRQYYGSLGMLYVEPSYRGKGLGKYLVTELARKVLKNNNAAFVLVRKDNEISYCLHRKCGFQELQGCDVAWKNYTPTK